MMSTNWSMPYNNIINYPQIGKEKTTMDSTLIGKIQIIGYTSRCQIIFLQSKKDFSTMQSNQQILI